MKRYDQINSLLSEAVDKIEIAKSLTECPAETPPIDPPEPPVIEPPIDEPDPIPDPVPDPDPIPVDPSQIIGELNFKQGDGLLEIYINTVKILESYYIGFGKNYAWSGTYATVTTNAPFDYTALTSNEQLGFNQATNIVKDADNSMVWSNKLSIIKDNPDIVGACIEFKFNRVVEPNMEVTFLENNQGFVITGISAIPDEAVTIQFSRPLHQVGWERPGNNTQLRAFFIGTSTTAGTTFDYDMTVTLPSQIEIAQTAEELLGTVPDVDWDANLINFEDSPVDLSFLNTPEKPAGKRGRLKAEGDLLVFPDGHVGKFWGTNINAYALYTSDISTIQSTANRLSKLGYNMVRLHHHDSYWVNPNIFGARNTDWNTDTVAEDMLVKIDQWIKALSDEGIYVWLDMATQRQHTEDQGIANWAEMSKGEEWILQHGWSYVDDDIHRLQKEFITQFMTHINALTGLSYADDPAVAWVLLNNENDLTNHFGNMLLADKNVPIASEKFLGEATTFAVENGLSVAETKRTWDAGTSKLFLNEMEHRSNVKLTSHIKNLGYEGLIAPTSQWAQGSQYCLTSLTEGDIIDVHTYGKFNDVSADPRHKASFLHFVGSSQVVGKPLSISEYQQESLPNSFDRFVEPVRMATMAAFQGWDIPMNFAYAQATPTTQWNASTYSVFSDPCLTSMLAVGALLFRQGHVKQANETYTLSFPVEEHYFNHVNANNSATIRTLQEQSRIVVDIPVHPSLPWHDPAQIDPLSKVVTNPNLDFIPAGQDHVDADTGEFSRNWKDGTFIVDTDKTQIISGWIGGKVLSTSDLLIETTNSVGAVAVQAYDNLPINESDHITISLASRTLFQEDKTYKSEPFNGFMTVRAKPGLKLYRVSSSGGEVESPVEYIQGVYKITLSKDLDTYWMKLR